MTELDLERAIDLASEMMQQNALAEAESSLRETLANIELLPNSDEKNNLFIRASHTLSFCLTRISSFSEAEIHAQRAVERLRESTPHRHAANAYYFLALAKYYLSDFQNALPLLQKSYALAEAHQDAKLLGRAANTIANVFFNLGDFAMATEHYQISLAQMRLVGNQSGIAMALNNIGVVFRTNRELKSALEVHEESLQIRRRINETSGIAMSLNNIANIYSDLCDYQTALTFANESAKLHEELNDSFGLALSLNIAARCQHNLGDINAAFENHWRSLLIRLNINDRFGEVVACLDLGELYSRNPSLPRRFPPQPSND